MPIDYKKYPKNWPQMRQKVLYRENHSCKQCGVQNYAIGYWDLKKEKFVILHQRETCAAAKKTKKRMKDRPGKKLVIIVLTVAHLDHDEWNHDVQIERLAALCQRCHLKYDRHDNAARKAYGKQYKRYQLQIL